MSTGTTISTDALAKAYGKLKALDGVTLDIHPGECIALVGPNGAGKSTLFKLCLGLIAPSGGTLSVLGRTPARAEFNAVKSLVGFLPEQAMFQDSLSGTETLRFYARLKGADTSLNKAILNRVHLSEAADRRVGTYSKGMRQRLGLAQALIGNPDLLLLDEPMSGLDPEARRNFFQILDEEKARGAAIVLSSHILTELEARDRPGCDPEPRSAQSHGVDRRVAREAQPAYPHPPQCRLQADAAPGRSLRRPLRQSLLHERGPRSWNARPSTNWSS